MKTQKDFASLGKFQCFYKTQLESFYTSEITSSIKKIDGVKVKAVI